MESLGFRVDRRCPRRVCCRHYEITVAIAARQKEIRAEQRAMVVDFRAISVFAVSPRTYLGRRPINSRLMIPRRRERAGT